MKFSQGTIEVERLLKLSNDQLLTFIVHVVEPVEVKEHCFKSGDGKWNMENCTGDNTCPYCSTYRTLMKSGEDSTVFRKWFPHSRYFLPISVNGNDLDIEPGEYVYRFGKPIYRAYIQLLTNCSRYKFDVDKPLTFTHRVTITSTFPNYDKCFFGFGKKILTVEKLCRDSESVRFV